MAAAPGAREAGNRLSFGKKAGCMRIGAMHPAEGSLCKGIDTQGNVREQGWPHLMQLRMSCKHI